MSAGGTSDVLVQPIVDALLKKLGKGIVIDNKPGASGMLGAAGRTYSAKWPHGDIGHWALGIVSSGYYTLRDGA